MYCFFFSFLQSSIFCLVGFVSAWYVQGVFEVKADRLVMTEIGAGFSVDDVQACTGCRLVVADNLKVMDN